MTQLKGVAAAIVYSVVAGMFVASLMRRHVEKTDLANREETT